MKYSRFSGSSGPSSVRGQKRGVARMVSIAFRIRAANRAPNPDSSDSSRLPLDAHRPRQTGECEPSQRILRAVPAFQIGNQFIRIEQLHLSLNQLSEARMNQLARIGTIHDAIQEQAPEFLATSGMKLQ